VVLEALNLICHVYGDDILVSKPIKINEGDTFSVWRLVMQKLFFMGI
jgi:hypothetical protein